MDPDQHWGYCDIPACVHGKDISMICNGKNIPVVIINLHDKVISMICDGKNIPVVIMNVHDKDISMICDGKNIPVVIIHVNVNLARVSGRLHLGRRGRGWTRKCPTSALCAGPGSRTLCGSVY